MIRKSWILLAAWVVASGSGVSADELLINGDFEEVLNIGWQQTIDGGTIYRATNYDPDDDYEVWVYKGTGSGGAWLSQDVAIAGTDVTFRAALRPLASATSTAWAASGISVAYLGESGQLLGETLLGVVTQYCPWENTPTSHVIEVDPGVWQERSFRIDEELVNLPGVDPTAVRGVRVTALVEIYDC